MIQVISERFIHTNILAQQRIAEKTHHRWLHALTIGCLITFVIGCFFAFLWIRVNILQTGYQISRSLAEQERMKQENNALRVERSALMSAARIEKIARGELGMVTPQAKQVIVLEW
jgi:cell division protein FtsL